MDRLSPPSWIEQDQYQVAFVLQFTCRRASNWRRRFVGGGLGINPATLLPVVHFYNQLLCGEALRKKDRLSGVLDRMGVLDVLWARQRGRLMNLCFHRIGTPSYDGSGDPSLFSMSEEEFSTTLRWLRKNADVLNEDELLDCLSGAAPWAQRPVCITFDDGYVDNYETAFPLLLENGLHAWFFVAPELASGSAIPWWDAVHQQCAAGALSVPEALHLLHQIKKLPATASSDVLRGLRDSYQRPEQAIFMSADQISSMAKAGMTIGAHTMSHRVLSTLSVAEQFREISASKRAVELTTGRSVRSFAYPVGDAASIATFTPGLVREAGFQLAFTFEAQTSTCADLDQFRLPRMAPLARHTTNKAAMVMPKVFMERQSSL